MNFFVWAGLFCLSFTWLFNLNLYTRESDSWWIVLLVLGILCNTAALKGKTTFNSIDKKCYLLVILLALSLLIIPFPYNLGIIMMIAGLFILCICSRIPILCVLSSGLILSGVMLVIQSPLGFLYTTFTTYSHGFFWLDGILHKIFSFLNLKVSYSQHSFYIQTIKDLYAFPTTWEKLAFFPLLNIWVGSIPLFYLFSDSKARGRGFLRLFLSGTAYIIIRYVFMVTLFLYLMNFVKYREEVCWINIFWDVRVTLFSFLPFVYFVCRLVPLKIREAGKVFVCERMPLSRLQRKALIYFSLAFFFLGWMYGFQDPGKRKNGRVVLDEKHSGWEKSTRKMDTEWYGNESGYNFYWMAEFINHHFILIRNYNEITPDLLSNADVLILKNPTTAYSPGEISNIRDFVKKGGGLFLLGEHTNVFGNSTYLNPVAEEFGFSFRYDVLFDIERKFEQLYFPPRLLPHPVVQNMPYFCFKVSCSIQPLSARCETIMASRGAKAQDIYYPSGNFYPPVKDHTYMPFGTFLQMVGIKSGKGRVAGFTDSTTYSNFEAFIEGKPELLLGTLNWLNRENSMSRLNSLFLILAVIFFSLAALTLREEKTPALFYVCLTVFCAFSMCCSFFICQALSRNSYQLPKAVTPYTKVVFEQEHGDYELPLKGFTKERERSYEVFYQWVLRVGYYPFTGKTLKQDVRDADILVIINPDKEFHPEVEAQMKGYLENGGNLLLMDSAGNGKSTANELLAPLGISIKKEKRVAIPSRYSTLWMRRMSQNYALAIEGGDALLQSVDGAPILSTAKIGKGTVAVMTFSHVFANPGMGGSYRVVPDAKQRQIYDLQFNILNGLVQGNLETFF